MKKITQESKEVHIHTVLCVCVCAYILIFFLSFCLFALESDVRIRF